MNTNLCKSHKVHRTHGKLREINGNYSKPMKFQSASDFFMKIITKTSDKHILTEIKWDQRRQVGVKWNPVESYGLACLHESKRNQAKSRHQVEVSTFKRIQMESKGNNTNKLKSDPSDTAPNQFKSRETKCNQMKRIQNQATTFELCSHGMTYKTY